MRSLFLAAALALTSAAAASAQEAPNARAAYAERRGLLEIDSRCRLFQPDIREALTVGAMQARGALLRAGWTNAQVTELESATTGAAANRPCADPRNESAAADARRAFATWANARTMEFPGWERTWVARRYAGEVGWRLSQTIDAPAQAVFGVRDSRGAQHLALTVPVARGAAAPNSATLIMRDVRRARVTEVALTRRMAYGLAAGLPAPGASVSIPSTRSIDRLDGGRSQALFTFPDTAFRDLMALDPRETVEIRLNTARGVQRLYVEVADVAAARAFLTIG